jgi:hypothetical protein
VDVGKDRVWTHGEVSIFHDDMPITLHFQESRQKLYVYHFISSDKTIADADWPRLFDTFDPETLPASKYLMGGAQGRDGGLPGVGVAPIGGARTLCDPELLP